MSGEKFTFPIEDGTVNISGGDQDHIHLNPGSPNRAEEQRNLPGESDGSSSTPFQDSLSDDGDARHDFWWPEGWSPKAGQQQAAADPRGS